MIKDVNKESARRFTRMEGKMEDFEKEREKMETQKRKREELIRADKQQEDEGIRVDESGIQSEGSFYKFLAGEQERRTLWF